MKSNVKKFASVLLAVAMLFSMCAVVRYPLPTPVKRSARP